MQRANRQYKIINGILYRLCECGCEIYILVGKTCHGVERQFAHGHYACVNKPWEPKPEPELCECGCGEYARPGKRFINGHYNTSKTGKNATNYKDGHKQKSKEWREEVLERDNYQCQRCWKVKRKGSVHLIAHHIKPKEDFPELRFILNNGQTLCHSCHSTIHHIEVYPSKETRDKMSKAKIGNTNSCKKDKTFEYSNTSQDC